MRNPVTLKALRRQLIERFRAGGFESPDIEARLILLAVTGFTPTELVTQREARLAPPLCRKIERFVSRRLSGEPLDHILGQKEFYGRPFKVSQDVLSPRPETEGVVDHALKLLERVKRPQILDLGTGSGAILITLMAERPDAQGIGVDISAPALAIARENARSLHVEARCDWRKGDWFDPVLATEKFDLILSNPPYITDMAMEDLSPEVTNYDPDIALRGGADGLNAYRAILEHAGDYLKPDGAIIFEIGYDQGVSVSKCVASSGFANVKCYQDLSGHDRVVIGTQLDH